MMNPCYRGYVLFRLARIGAEKRVVEAILKHVPPDGSKWPVSYAAATRGMWDVVVEVTFTDLAELDKVVTFARTNPEMQELVEETTTLLSTRPTFEPEDLEEQPGKI
ncbi:MAG: hypothetical protein Kow0069_35640 [Promethearchaeota archaeon]